MEKKYLFVAGLLPLLMASCNNELEGIVNENAPTPNEIIGSNLVSKGATLNVTRDDANATSRIAAGNVWESSDKVALAWYNIATAEGANNIFDEQKKPNTWKSTSINDATSSTDNKIYGNLMFFLSEGGSTEGSSFTTQGNVYQGAHFAYYPYQYQKQVGELIFTPNSKENPQKSTYDKAQYDEATLVSAQDFIEGKDVKDGTLNKDFTLKRITNLLGFTLQPSEIFTSEDHPKLRSLAIEYVTLSGGEGLFNPSVKIVPAKLPTAYYDKNGYNNEETLKKMQEAENLFGENKPFQYNATPSKNITTYVDSNLGFTLSENRTVRMFLLPTNKIESVPTTNPLTITVKTKWGTFKVSRTDKVESNKENLEELFNRLYGIDTKVNLQKLYNSKEMTRAYQLTAENFSPAYNINNIDDWYDALEIAKELGRPKATFTLTNEVRFTDAMLPADYPVEITVQKSSETSKGAIIIAGDVTLPTKNLSFETTKTQVPVTVEADATLTIPEADAAAASADYEGYKGLSTSKVLNNGTIVVGKYATVEAVDNQNRIEVIYGSYVTLAEDGAAGVIAYNILNEEKETKAYQINNLIANKTTATQKRLAAVNTLVIANGVKFDLSMTDQGADANDDPYTPSAAGQNTKLNSLAAITIEMKGGKLSNIDLVNQTVKGIKVLDGSNEIEDVTTTLRGNGLTVSGGEVTFTTAQEITEVNANKAFVTINGNMEVANNANAKAMTNVYVSGMINNNGTITANVGEGAIHANGTINTTNGTTKGVVIKGSATDF